MNLFSRIMTVACVAGLLSGCATSAHNIDPAYVSPMQYQSYDCDQIRSEMMRVSRKVNEISGVQDKQHTKDSVALGVGLIVFWPALFFMMGNDKHQELSQLKGEYDALEQAAIQKKCNVANEIEAAKKAEEARLEKQKQQSKETGKTNN